MRMQVEQWLPHQIGMEVPIRERLNKVVTILPTLFKVHCRHSLWMSAHQSLGDLQDLPMIMSDKDP